MSVAGGRIPSSLASIPVREAHPGNDAVRGRRSLYPFLVMLDCFCRAADWKDQVWVGKLQVVTKGKNVAIRLVGEDGKVSERK